MRATRRARVLAATATAGLALGGCAGDASSRSPVLDGPEVVASGSSPTGYEVTFRLAAPDADQVWLAGDLYLTTPDLLGVAGASRSWLGDGWTPGDVPTLPLAEDLAPLTRGDDGVWELTAAVPAGLWNYGFVTRECTLVLVCEVTADPANPAPLATDPDEAQQWSRLFVPVDPAHPTYDAADQLPAAPAERGTVEARTYASALSVDPAGRHALGVYLPAGFDPDREEPYPLLVLSHGAYDDETAWWIKGGAAEQLDHAIATGEIPPVVAITTDFSGLSADGMEDPAFFDLYARELVDSVLPYAESHLHATADPALRAFAGLSMGGRLAEHLMLTRADLFDAYGMWSMPAAVAPHGAAEDLTDAELATAATARAVHLGTGAQDPLTAGAGSFEALAARYREAGLTATTLETEGDHSWWVWRRMLGDFLATTAFAS
ncbi:alpha/beta hydrolase-fold protein [Demequina soli]|uniref:alpha/beta hydrolase-fold protein n=1 Tax=Demequina soli TaxID=1638987 RepID=UPI0007821ECD|nr:alpha/beta hydrolase-fold protein [Demequina soli]